MIVLYLSTATLKLSEYNTKLIVKLEHKQVKHKLNLNKMHNFAIRQGQEEELIFNASSSTKFRLQTGSVHEKLQ